MAGLDLFGMTREYLVKSFYDLLLLITFILYRIWFCENPYRDIFDVAEFNRQARFIFNVSDYKRSYTQLLTIVKRNKNYR